MQKKIIKARDVMHEKHLELDGMATVKEALDAMKAENASVVIVKKRHEHDAFGIVLLSDGRDTVSEISESEMFSACLPQSESADVVKVFTIAYGTNAEQELLEQIAERTYGRAFVADPDNIGGIVNGHPVRLDLQETADKVATDGMTVA